MLSIAWTLSYYFLIERAKNRYRPSKASNDATYGSKWTMFFVSLVVGVLFGIVIFQAICNAIGIGFIVRRHVRPLRAGHLGRHVHQRFVLEQLKDNVE